VLAFSPASVSPPPPFGTSGTHSLAGEGVGGGGPNSDRHCGTVVL
jgi:hypothetical protein